MVRFIQVSKVEKKLRGNNFQIKKPCYEEIDRIVGFMLDALIEGAQSEGIKSIGTDYIARQMLKGNLTKKKSSDVLADKNTGCKRCGILKKPFIEFAKNLQVFTIEEAKVIASKYM